MVRLTIVSGALILAAGCGSGGGGSVSMPEIASSPGSCPESGMPKLAASCCESGVRVKFDGDCAGPELGGVPAITGANANGASAARIAEASNTAAAKLVGVDPAVLSGGSSAATADQKITMAPPAEPKKELENNFGKNTPERGGNDSGNGGSNSGGGGLGSLYSGRTAPSAPETAPNLVMSEQSQAAVVAAVAGKGKGSTTGSGTSSGLSWSGLGQAARAPGADSVSFGAGENSVNPIGSADPADYFAKLGLDESIFKVVERRYRTKSMDWATREFSTEKAKLK